jgi:hypothetical protein
METIEALKKIDINPRAGAIRAVQAVGEMIQTAPDPLSVANAVIVELGGNEELDFPTARITAKAFVERAVRAVEAGEKFDPTSAQVYATEKVLKLRGQQPEVFTKTAADAAAAPKKRGRPATNGGDLKAKAMAICAANKSLTNGEIAQLVQKELSITYSNAYYYVSRVFKR